MVKETDKLGYKLSTIFGLNWDVVKQEGKKCDLILIKKMLNCLI